MLFYIPLLNFWREKYHSELRILASALFIAIFAVTTLMSLFSAIDQSLTGAASALLGADLMAESSDPLPPAYKQQALKLGMTSSASVEFFSMVVASNQYVLASISAIEDNFPLQGELNVLTTEGIQHVGPPPAGHVWMQADLSKRLKVNLNDYVSIGEGQFIFSGILQEIPLAMSSNSNFAPIVYVNANDLDKMSLIQPGSRILYRLLLKGSLKQINVFKAHFRSASTVTLISPSEGRLGIKQTLRFAKRYSAVILLIQIILAGIAVMMCSYHYSIRQQKKVALLRTMGASSYSVIKIEMLSLLLFAVMILILAIAAGYSVAKVLLPYHHYFGLPKGNLGWEGGVYGGLTGIVLLTGFMLGPLLSLKNITPLSILQRVKPYPQWNVLMLLFSLGLLWALFAFWIGEGGVALRMGLQIGVLSLLILLLSYGLWQSFARLSRYGPLSWRFGVAYMVRHKWHSIIQWLVFSIVIAMLLLIQIIQQNINTFKTRLPLQTPNFFLLNIQPSQVEDLKKWMAEKNITAVNFYPIVRARMKGLQRPLNMTWMRVLPEDNQVVEGIHWDKVNDGQPVISVEKNFSERQGFKLNDVITFQIGEALIEGKIVQLRRVEWESFKPNFFVIFPPKILDKFPHSYITSFYLSDTHKNIIIDLIKNYAEISVIDIDAILKKIRTMIDKIALVLQALLVSVLVMGILIMYISLQSSLKERLSESAMLQILGANKLFVLKVLMIEFAIMGVLSGLAGSLMAIIIAYGLNKHYFELPFVFKFSLVVGGMIGGIFMIVLFGFMGSRSIFRVSPLWLFKQNA